MFYIGSNVLDLPLEAQRGVTDGHEVCIRMWTHNFLPCQRLIGIQILGRIVTVRLLS